MEALKEVLFEAFLVVFAIVVAIGLVLTPTLFIAWLLSLDGL